MNFFDDEKEIIELFRITQKHEVYFPRQTTGAMAVFHAIHNEKKWRHWIDSSGKADPPPDFFSDKYGYMMEIMRVDDHAHFNKNGALINPVNQRETVLQKEIRKVMCENNSSIDIDRIKILVTADSGLPSYEDHNYSFYYANFARVLKKHIDRIPLYRKNHPNKKLIFFVFDESTGYLETDDEELVQRGLAVNEPFVASPVWHFFDKRFIDVFKDTDIDYLVWYSPYKEFHGVPIQPPKVCVFDIKKYKYKHVVYYPENLIISSEA